MFTSHSLGSPIVFVLLPQKFTQKVRQSKCQRKESQKATETAEQMEILLKVQAEKKNINFQLKHKCLESKCVSVCKGN